MPVFSCSRGCPRLISVSAIPGGSPVALADPEGYAVSYLDCAGCHTKTCDRCARKNPQLAAGSGCPKCGKPLAWAGVPLPGGAAASAPATAPRPPAAGPPPGGGRVNLVETLIGLGRSIDADLSARNSERANATAVLATTLMGSLADQATMDDLPHLSRFGEQFFRWEMFRHGAQYYRALYQRCMQLGVAQQAAGNSAITLAGAFDYLSGGMDSKPDMARSVVQMVQAHFGPQHPLTQKVQQRAASLGGAAQIQGAFGAPQWNMTPAAAPPPPQKTKQQADEELSLWITLAFLRISASDGSIDNREYLVFKQTIQQFQLPDLWDRYGTEGLMKLLREGKLQSLSAGLAGMPLDSKKHLGEILKKLMLADGKIEHGELVAIQEITGWLGMTLGDIGIRLERA
ncbi:MAG: hypothetical protein H6719_19130 [Sandaracinaceae bacterium]|nr:hypothetical protein [Sandaracinaceae bacterium]